MVYRNKVLDRNRLCTKQVRAIGEMQKRAANTSSDSQPTDLTTDKTRTGGRKSPVAKSAQLYVLVTVLIRV